MVSGLRNDSMKNTISLNQNIYKTKKNCNPMMNKISSYVYTCNTLGKRALLSANKII